MEMHQVRYFLAVARERNFTRAAETCNVTQPSLTRAIQKLEEEFGGPLFRRERALTHLTELGRLMLPHLERTYEAAQAARALARDVERQRVAPLSLGLADDVDLPGLPDLLQDLGRAFPGFALTLVQGPADQLIEKAMAGDLDAVIAAVPAELPARVDCWPLRDERLCLMLAADHPLADRAGLRAEDFEGMELIALDHPSVVRFRERVPTARPGRHQAGSAAAAAMMAAAGLGAALLPEGVPVPPGGRLVPVEGMEPARTVALAAVAGRRRSPATDAFLKSVRARGW
jgi:DNA-binding transcriptional LysR family regulator